MWWKKKPAISMPQALAMVEEELEVDPNQYPDSILKTPFADPPSTILQDAKDQSLAQLAWLNTKKEDLELEIDMIEREAKSLVADREAAVAEIERTIEGLQAAAAVYNKESVNFFEFVEVNTIHDNGNDSVGII